MLQTLRSRIDRPLAFATGAVCLATLLALGGRWFWLGDMLANFHTHFFMLSCLALVLALALRRWGVAGIAVICLALNAWPIQGAFFAAAPPPVTDGRPVRVAAFNVQVSNENMPAVASYLEAQKVDVAVLEEMTPSNADRLAELLPQLPHRHLAVHEGVRGVVILSRWPLSEPHALMEEGVKFAARVEVNLGDRGLRLYGVHLNWPVMPETAYKRNAQLRLLGRELGDCPQACVAVGDFNTTPWSAHFRDVLKVPGVHDCAAGRGLLPTWSSSLPAPLRIRIDHCLAAGAVAVVDVRVGESLGSDHFSTINELLIGKR